MAGVSKGNISRSRALVIPVVSMNRIEAAMALPDSVLKWVLWDILVVLDKPGDNDLMRMHPWVVWAHDSWDNWRWLFGLARVIHLNWQERARINLPHAAWVEIKALNGRKYRPSKFKRRTSNGGLRLPGPGTVPGSMLKAAGGNVMVASELWIEQIKQAEAKNAERVGRG